MSSIDLSKPNRDTTLLAPFVQNRLLMALNECHDLGYPVAVFEAYRSPARQNYLWELGRNGSKARKVTNARAWQSNHQYGLAIDLAFLPRPRAWHWPKSDDPIWDRCKRSWKDLALNPSNGKGHILKLQQASTGKRLKRSTRSRELWLCGILWR